MSLSILFWNAQGAAFKWFRRIFCAVSNNYKPTMVVSLQPRISGDKADDFIKHSGFDKSHWIEANGFSGGIWILWQDKFDVEVFVNHKQFVHFRISEKNVLLSWVTAVYGRPNPSIRKHL